MIDELLAAAVLVTAFVLVAVMLAKWPLPLCGADEVAVRGVFAPYVCVKGH